MATTDFIRKTKDYQDDQKMSGFEYSPWGMIFYRDHHLMMTADECSVMVHSGNLEHLRMYFAVLRQILVNIQPLFKPRNIPKWFDEIDKIEINLEDWETNKSNGEVYYPKELIKKLRFFHRKIMFVKQYIGYGVPRYTKRRTRDEIKMALLGKDERQQ